MVLWVFRTSEVFMYGSGWAERADIYLKLVSLLIAYLKRWLSFHQSSLWSVLYAYLAWCFRHPVIRYEWKACIKKKSCCVQKQELCQIFGLLLPSLTASWLFRWHIMFKSVFVFLKDLYQITQCWLLDYRLNSSFLPHLSVTRNDIEPVMCFCFVSFRALKCA